MNLVFVNLMNVMGGLAPRIQHGVRNGNYLRQEERYQSRVLQGFGIIDIGYGGWSA